MTENEGWPHRDGPLFLSARARNVLRRNGVYTVEELRRVPLDEMRGWYNCGGYTVAEISTALANVTVREPNLSGVLVF